MSRTTVLRLYRYEGISFIRNIFVLFSKAASSKIKNTFLQYRNVDITGSKQSHVNHPCHEATMSPNTEMSILQEVNRVMSIILVMKQPCHQMSSKRPVWLMQLQYQQGSRTIRIQRPNNKNT
jgi:hypothetical protein